MSETKIRLDRSRPFSTNHGERTPDDPLYLVHFWQGGMLGPHRVVLPFDAHGDLVSDDGQVGDKPGIDAEGKQIKYKPLYDANMKKFLALKSQRAKALASVPAAETIKEDGVADPDEMDVGSPVDDVNLEAWLRGKTDYPASKVREAYRLRYHHSTDDLREIVSDLVLDRGLIPEADLRPDLQRHLDKAGDQAAA
jgi:hypothetical protein